jgi:hypothetical protein
MLGLNDGYIYGMDNGYAGTKPGHEGTLMGSRYRLDRDAILPEEVEQIIAFSRKNGGCDGCR